MQLLQKDNGKFSKKPNQLESYDCANIKLFKHLSDPVVTCSVNYLFVGHVNRIDVSTRLCNVQEVTPYIRSNQPGFSYILQQLNLTYLILFFALEYSQLSQYVMIRC